MIRFQVEAFIGGIVNSEAAHQAGQKVAIQTREVQTISTAPSMLVSSYTRPLSPLVISSTRLPTTR